MPVHHRAWTLMLSLAVLPHIAQADPELTAEEEALLRESLQADAQGDDDAPSTFNSVAATVSNAVQSFNPDISVILDVALAYFSQEPLQSGAHDPVRTGFTLQQLELSLGASVDPFFRLDTNLVFSQFGVELEEAYGTTLALPWNLQARAGQFLTRFGRINATHPHSWDFMDQPLVVGRFFGSEGNRGLGGELSWLAPLPWYVEVVGSVNDAAGECCARSYYGAQDLGVRGPADLLYTTALKQFFPFDDNWSLAWGLSGQFGPNPTGNGNRTEIYGTDLYLRYRPVANAGRTSVSITIESLYRARQVPRDVLRDFGTYAQIVWRLNQDWDVGARYEFIYGLAADWLDPLQSPPSAHRKRVSAAVTFYPSHFARLRLQGAYDAPGWRPQPTWAVMLGLELLTGAHGAHEY